MHCAAAEALMCLSQLADCLNCVHVICCCRSSNGMQIEAHDGSVALAHKALGSVAFALLLLQVGGALVALPGFTQ